MSKSDDLSEPRLFSGTSLKTETNFVWMCASVLMPRAK